MRTLVALCLVMGCSADFLSHVGVPAGVQSVVSDGDDTMPADVTKLSVAQLTGVPLPYLHGVPSFSFPAAVPVNTEVDSDEITTAVHAVPYTFPHFTVVPAKTTLETQQVETVDAAVPADTSKLAITTQQHEVSVPTFNYYNNFGYGFPYNNFGYGFYNHYNPLRYSAAGYPYQFGFPYNFGYNYAPIPYAAAPAEDSSDEEED